MREEDWRMVGVRRAPAERITQGERRRNLRFGFASGVELTDGGVTIHPSTPAQIFSEEVDSGDQMMFVTSTPEIHFAPAFSASTRNEFAVPCLHPLRQPLLQ